MMKQLTSIFLSSQKTPTVIFIGGGDLLEIYPKLASQIDGQNLSNLTVTLNQEFFFNTQYLPNYTKIEKTKLFEVVMKNGGKVILPNLEQPPMFVALSYSILVSMAVAKAKKIINIASVDENNCISGVDPFQRVEMETTIPNKMPQIFVEEKEWIILSEKFITSKIDTNLILAKGEKGENFIKKFETTKQSIFHKDKTEVFTDTPLDGE